MARIIIINFSKYAILDQFAATSAAIKGHATNFDEAVATIVKSDWSEDHNWLYHYDVSYKASLSP